MALGEVLPEPPAGAGLVVVETAGLVVLEAEVDFLPRLEDQVGDAEHHHGHDDHGDDPAGVLLPLGGLLLGFQPGLAAGLLTLSLLGGHGGSG